MKVQVKSKLDEIIEQIENNSVTDVDLRGEKIDDEGAARLAMVLEKNRSVTSLDLTGNGITDKGAESLAGPLEKNTSLTALYLGSNQIGDKGVESLAGALEKNIILITLHLGSNQIGDKGATSLANMLEHNVSLTRLYLQSNQIGDTGAASFADALEKNISRLAEFYLEWNKITDTGTKRFPDALKKNDSITMLYLGNGIDPEIQYAIEEKLTLNRDYKKQTEAQEENEKKEAAVKSIFDFIDKADHKAEGITIPNRFKDYAKGAFKIAYSNLNNLVYFFSSAIENFTKNDKNIFTFPEKYVDYESIKVLLSPSIKFADFDRLPKHTAAEHFLHIKQIIALQKTFKIFLDNQDFNHAKEAFLKTLEIFEEFTVDSNLKCQMQLYADAFIQQIKYTEVLSRVCSVACDEPLVIDGMRQVIRICAGNIDASLEKAIISLKIEPDKDINYYQQAIEYLGLERIKHYTDCEKNKAYKYLGDIYKQQGNTEEARLNYYETWKLNTEAERAAMSNKSLEEWIPWRVQKALEGALLGNVITCKFSAFFDGDV